MGHTLGHCSPLLLSLQRKNKFSKQEENTVVDGWWLSCPWQGHAKIDVFLFCFSDDNWQPVWSGSNKSQKSIANYLQTSFCWLIDSVNGLIVCGKIPELAVLSWTITGKMKCLTKRFVKHWQILLRRNVPNECHKRAQIAPLVLTLPPNRQCSLSSSSPN